ncbi:Histidine decarboxylase protein [Dioscorea alata]|uniref:Histidine decarboxylase protein n=1 Tax=Dioscorea alata TaxID=55571 RepID=A0ACB7U8T8_DIOAL|nr:Histidine decarboxylase protein [Dioscorea alata]
MVESLWNGSLVDLSVEVEPLPWEFDPNGDIGENGKEREIVLGRNVHTMCLTKSRLIMGNPFCDYTFFVFGNRLSLFLDFDYCALGQLQHFLINNLGDPFTDSN